MLRQRYWYYVRLFLAIGVVAIHSSHAVAADDETAPRDVGQIKLKKLREASGIAASRLNADILWVHNDGSAPLVYAVKTSGKLAALVGFSAEIEDFEDVAIGPGPKAGVDYLYVGDIGDNTSSRKEIRVVRFPEPQVSNARNSQIEIDGAEVFRLKYPRGEHNAEALFVDPVSSDLFIVAKENGKSPVFTCQASDLKDKELTVLKHVVTLKIDKVSGGAISWDGHQIILRREDKGWLWNRARNESVAQALQSVPQSIPVRGTNQGRNGEAVSFSDDGHSYFTVSEGKEPVICQFELPDPKAPPSLSPIDSGQPKSGRQRQ
jgi:hypothetical protein